MQGRPCSGSTQELIPASGSRRREQSGPRLRWQCQGWECPMAWRQVAMPDDIPPRTQQPRRSMSLDDWAQIQKSPWGGFHCIVSSAVRKYGCWNSTILCVAIPCLYSKALCWFSISNYANRTMRFCENTGLWLTSANWLAQAKINIAIANYCLAYSITIYHLAPPVTPRHKGSSGGERKPQPFRWLLALIVFTESKESRKTPAPMCGCGFSMTLSSIASDESVCVCDHLHWRTQDGTTTTTTPLCSCHLHIIAQRSCHEQPVHCFELTPYYHGLISPNRCFPYFTK